MLGNPTCYQNAIPTLCWIFVNQPFHLQTVGKRGDVESLISNLFLRFQFVSSLQNEILQLVLNNSNFLSENVEMNNLFESVRYGLKSLLNSTDTSPHHQDILNNLLKVNFDEGRSHRFFSSSSLESSENEFDLREKYSFDEMSFIIELGESIFRNRCASSR